MTNRVDAASEHPNGPAAGQAGPDELAPLASSTRLVTREKRNISHDQVRSGTVFGTVRLLLHSSRAVTVVTAIEAPRCGGGHVTGYAGADSSRFVRFDLFDQWSNKSTPVPRDGSRPRALRHGATRIAASTAVVGPTG